MRADGLLRSALLTLAVVAAATELAAQEPRAAPPPMETHAAAPAANPATADPDVTIRITAVVTDRRGRPVGGLRPSDFTLLDNGVPQTLTAAEPREAGSRLFAIFLDEYHVSPGAPSAAIREALLRFVDGEVRPEDRLCVLKPLDSVRSIQCTPDRGAARAAIASVEGRRGDLEPRTAFEREFFGRAPRAVEFARAQIVAAALRELMLRIGELQPPRAALVLAAGVMSRTAGEGRRLPGWLALARAASHFNLPIYTLDPRPPEPPPDTPPVAAAGAAADGTADRATTLETLARQTGGEPAAGPASLDAALTRMSRDLDAGYVLAYRPSEPTDGRFHPVELTSARGTVTVRAPSGYWSPLASEWRTWLARAETPPAPAAMRAQHRSRLIEMWYGFEPEPDGSLRLLLTWSPAGTGPPSPRSPRPSSVALKASTLDGDRVFEGGVPAVPVPAEFDAPPARAEFPVSAGRLLLDLAIESPDGRVLDTGAQDIEVPAFRGPRPALLQPQFVRARTRTDVERLAGSDGLSPTPARTFRRTERLLLRVPVYTPGNVPGVVTATIVNVRGQKIRDLEALPPSRSGTAQFDMPVAFLPPGDYGLELAVETPGGAARQLVRFVLTG
jgi:VWFA-related protein